ncbi:hypothetical protein VNI00_001797 [Paramarasmius palmivorus]|uniref:Thioredoxin domain-containing protein n=1 Tax=Paramarasmius palmivorus TaxID=297713 RepID=A0AAW0E1U0_9AGAR
MSSVLSIATHKDFQSAIANNRFSFVQYTATWCCWCERFSPVFDKASTYATFADLADFYRIDCTRTTSENRQAQKLAKADGFPHVGVFHSGQFVLALEGYQDWDEFHANVSKLFELYKTMRMQGHSSPVPQRSKSDDTEHRSSIRRRVASFVNLNNSSRGSLSSLSSLSMSNMSIRSTLASCTGIHRDRQKEHWYKRLFSKYKSFRDPESGCIYVPTEEGDGLQIGRANYEDSFFYITVAYSGDETKKNMLLFGVEFCADATKRMRFTSAMLKVTFGFEDEDGVQEPLRVHDMSPKEDHGEFTEVRWGKGREGNLNMSAGYSAVSVGAESKFSQTSEYTRRTSSWVRGCGIHTPSAEWTFKEDDGQAGRHGLNPQYQLSVTLPRAASTKLIWIEFWSKAVLARGDQNHTVTLRIGTEEEPYKRNLDMNSGISIVRHEESEAQAEQVDQNKTESLY